MSKLAELEHRSLSPSFYQRVSVATFNFQSIRAQCRSIARRIAKHEGCPKLANIINKSLDGIFPTILGTTVKTHKPQFEVGLRPLHKACRPALLGLSTWLASKLAPILDSLDFFMKDSFAVKKQLQGLHVPIGGRLAVFDIKDFFLSGMASEVSHDVSTLFQHPLSGLIKEVTFTLLDYQIIFAEYSSTFYKCFKGTGMGLNHSGFLANLAYYVKVEKAFVSRLASLGIRKYLRYHDDIVIIFDTRDALLAFTPYVKNTAYFKVLCNSVSCSYVEFLELGISIDSTTRNILVQPLLNKIPIPLCRSSCHEKGVHISWPSAVRNRAVVLAHDRSRVVADLLSAYAQTIHGDDFSSLMHRTRSQAHISDSLEIVNWVLRFHPCIHSAVRSILRAVPLPAHLGLRIRPSWSNALPSIEGVIATANSDTTFDNNGFLRREGSSLLSLLSSENCSFHNMSLSNLNNLFNKS